MSEQPTITYAKLSRIENDLHRLRRSKTDGPMLSRFAYDHSHTLVIDSEGKRDLLISNSVPLASDIARLLQHVSPAMVAEFVRGYKLAKAAGLLGDGAGLPVVVDLLGKHALAEASLLISKHNRKPGGFANDEG